MISDGRGGVFAGLIFLVKNMVLVGQHFAFLHIVA